MTLTCLCVDRRHAHIIVPHKIVNAIKAYTVLVLSALIDVLNVFEPLFDWLLHRFPKLPGRI